MIGEPDSRLKTPGARRKKMAGRGKAKIFSKQAKKYSG
jgi:hypothetical protein